MHFFTGGDLILTYRNPITTDDNLTLSLDNIVFDCKVSNPKLLDSLSDTIHLISSMDVNLRHWENFRIGCYKQNFRFETANGNSFWLGSGLNLKKTEYCRVRLDFNPNKVGGCTALQNIVSTLLLITRQDNRSVARYDLAIDIPVDRFDCFLIKDNRAYIERRHGQEWTQYLGAKSSHLGRVKLYNKQVEAKLNCPLTRMEITLSPDIAHTDIPFPKVYYISSQQVAIADCHLTDTERFVLNAILQGCGSTRELGRKARAKIESLLDNYVKYVQLGERDYSEVARRLETFRTKGII